MFDWLLINQTIAQLGFCLTITSQFTLIFLTLFFVRRDFGAYKYLIVLFSTVGISFASLEFVLYPILHSHNAGYIFFTTIKPFNASNEFLTAMLALYTGIYSTTISLLSVQFIYRYIAVFKSNALKYFNGWFFPIWIFYAAWFDFEWGFGFFVFNEMDEYSQNYMRQELREVYGVDISNVPCQVHVVYQNSPNSTNSLIRWKNVMCTFNLTFIMSFQYGVIIYCGYKLWYDMDQKINVFSSEMRKLHHQIFKTLMLQITTPTFVLFSPIVFVIYAPFFDLELSVPTGIFLSGFTLYPALDAFILMYVVTDYREAFKKYSFFEFENIVSMIDLFLIEETIAQLGFYLTFSTQFTLIFLTLFFVRKDLGAYKYLIILFSIVGISFASLEFVLYPVLHSHNAGYIFFTTTRPLNASNEILTAMLALYTGLYSTTISLLAVQFIYRYIAVFDSDRLKYFKRWHFIIWVLYAAWFGFEWGFGFYVFNAVDDYSENYMTQELHKVYGIDISNVPCQVHVVYQNIPNSTDSLIRWRNVMCTFNLTFIMSFQYGIMIYCGYNLWHDMDQKISMLSIQMKKLHRQIFRTLILQITSPTLVLFSPIVFVIYAPYFDLELSVPTGIFLSGFTLYPALDACILMYVITDYRRAFKKILTNISTSKSSS